MKFCFKIHFNEIHVLLRDALVQNDLTMQNYKQNLDRITLPFNMQTTKAPTYTELQRHGHFVPHYNVIYSSYQKIPDC